MSTKSFTPSICFLESTGLDDIETYSTMIFIFIIFIVNSFTKIQRLFEIYK